MIGSFFDGTMLKINEKLQTGYSGIGLKIRNNIISLSLSKM